MTIALMIFATAAAYAAGIATMLVVSSRRAKLAEPIPPAWLPHDVKVEPPPKPSAPVERSPFAPKLKPKPVEPEPPRKRLLHWPAPVAPQKPPSMPSVSFLPHNEL
jgi:hypothetical protein